MPDRYRQSPRRDSRRPADQASRGQSQLQSRRTRQSESARRFPDDPAPSESPNANQPSEPAPAEVKSKKRRAQSSPAAAHRKAAPAPPMPDPKPATTAGQ